MTAAFEHEHETGNATIRPDYDSHQVLLNISTGGTTETIPLSPAKALKTSSVIKDLPPELLQFTDPEGVSKTLVAAVDWLKQQSGVVDGIESEYRQSDQLPQE